MKPSQLEQVIKELHSEAYLWARQCCNFDEESAKDVLQDVYLKILEGKASFKEKSSIKTWLFAVIRFTAAEALRKKKPSIQVDVHSEILDIPETEIPESYEDLNLLLPERQREVLLLVFYHGLTLDKAAAVLELQIGTIRTHYDRGKKNLKELILKKRAYENAGE